MNQTLRSQWNKRELFECALVFIRRILIAVVIVWCSFFTVVCLLRCDGNDNNNDGYLL